MEPNQIFTTLSKMVKKKYLQKFRDWHETATLEEKKGVNIIKFILNSKGHQKVDKSVFTASKTAKDLLKQKFRYFGSLD